MAPSRTMRQATVGLLALASLATLGYAWVWLRGFGGGRSYRAIIEFTNAGGMQSGTAVAYRGVRVGKVVGVQPRPTGVDIEVEISPGNLLIPRNSRIEANQSGLIGETAIDITPLQDLPLESEIAPPLDPSCDTDVIICDGSRLAGEAQLDVNALIRSLLRIANILSSPEFASNLNAVSRNASIALAEIAELGDEVQNLFADEPLTEPLAAITTAAAGIDEAATGINEFVGSLEAPLVTSLESLDATTARIANVIDNEGDTLRGTLSSIEATSDELRAAVAELTPVLAEVSQSDIVENFDALSADAAAAVESVRGVTDRVGDPESIILLQKTLDSARAAFENVMKITADVDEVTGDPQFRDNVRELIEALENLLSSTQQLERQIAQAKLQRSLASAESESESSER